ncbi:MAG TPA: hypothetical protein VNS55_09160 [Nocardioides sp.]|nr:hypothetical protein [Nocardioides sp.]
MIGPAFSVVAQDRTSPVAATAGNVLEPRPERDRVPGGYPPAWSLVSRNLRALVR